MTSAWRKPAAASPFEKVTSLAMLEGFSGLGSAPAVTRSSCSSGALSAIASSTSMTCGNTSYSTSISSSASVAIAGETAATAAMAWPSYSALPRAMTLRDRSRKFIGPSPTKASSGPISGKSAAVAIARTPGSASALSALILIIRVRVGAAFDLAVKHPRQCPIGTEIGATRDLLDSIGANWPGPDDFQAVLIGFGCHDRSALLLNLLTRYRNIL